MVASIWSHSVRMPLQILKLEKQYTRVHSRHCQLLSIAVITSIPVLQGIYGKKLESSFDLEMYQAQAEDHTAIDTGQSIIDTPTIYFSQPLQPFATYLNDTQTSLPQRTASFDRALSKVKRLSGLLPLMFIVFKVIGIEAAASLPSTQLS